MPLLKQKFFLFIFQSVFCLFLFVPNNASAAILGGLVPCGGYNTPSNKPCTVEDAFVMVARVTNFLIACSGIYAVYVIINSSFGLIVYSMGNEEAITKAKSGITNAVVGFVLVLFAYMLVNTVTNVLLTRSIATANPECIINLKDPLTYLTINQKPCSGLSPDVIYSK